MTHEWTRQVINELTLVATSINDDLIEVMVSHEDGRHLSETFRPFHRPIFGLDVDDSAEIMRIAEALATRLDQGQGTKAAPEA